MHPLAVWRKEKGLSQQKLALELDTYQANISAWELGRSIPRAENIYKIACYFDKDINELYQIFPLIKK